jgi:hypothetical protein
MSIAEIDEVSENAAATPDTAPWTRELEHWSSLPFESPVWDDVDGFVNALRELARAKLEDRNVGREALRRSLDELRRDFGGDLEYFEATDEQWSADAVAWDEAEMVAARVARLREQLESRRPLLSRKANSYSETRRLREETNAAEEAISGHLADLSGMFSGEQRAAPLAEAERSGEEPALPEGAVSTSEGLEEGHTDRSSDDFATGYTDGGADISAGDAAVDSVPSSTDDLTHSSADGSTENSAESADFGFVYDSPESGGPVQTDEQVNDGFAYPPGTVELPDFDAPAAVDSAAPVAEENTAVEATPNFSGVAFRNGTPSKAGVIPLAHSETATPTPLDVPAKARPNGSVRRLLDAAADRYSPLTTQQERTILTAGPGVGLILASSIMGFEQLPDAVATLAETVFDQRAAYTTIPASISDEKEIYDWLAKFASHHPEAERLIACQPVVMPTANIAARVQGALRFCDEGGHPLTRVLFFFGPGASWVWLNLPDEKWEELAGQIHPRFALRPWTEEALRARLDRHGLPSDPEACALALGTTGGWSWCVDKLFELCQEGTDFASAAERLIDGFARGGELHDELLMRVGVRVDTVADAVLKLILQQGEMPAEMVTPDRVGGNATPDECRAAVELLKAMCCVEGEEGNLHVTPFLARALQG